MKSKIIKAVLLLLSSIYLCVYFYLNGFLLKSFGILLLGISISIIVFLNNNNEKKMRKIVEGIIVFTITIIIFLDLIYDDLINKWVLSLSYLLLAIMILFHRFNHQKK